MHDRTGAAKNLMNKQATEFILLAMQLNTIKYYRIELMFDMYRTARIRAGTWSKGQTVLR